MTGSRYVNNLLLEAVQIGDIAQVVNLLVEGADVNHSDDNGYTALHVAALNGRCEFAKLMLNAGANLNALTRNGHTPLHTAAQYGNCPIAQLLIDAGANVNAVARLGSTILHYAVEKRSYPMIQLLLNAGANINAIRYCDHRTPLFMAVLSRDSHIVKLLLRAGAHVDVADIQGMTPLCRAVMWYHHDITLQLLAAGADTNLVLTNKQYNDEWSIHPRAFLAKFLAEIENKKSLVNTVRLLRHNRASFFSFMPLDLINAYIDPMTKNFSNTCIQAKLL